MFISWRTTTIATPRLPLDPNHGPFGGGLLLRATRMTSLPPLARRPRVSRARCRRRRFLFLRRTKRRARTHPPRRGRQAKTQGPSRPTPRSSTKRRTTSRPPRVLVPRAAVVGAEARPGVGELPRRLVRRSQHRPLLRRRGRLLRLQSRRFVNRFVSPVDYTDASFFVLGWVRARERTHAARPRGAELA